MHTQAIEYFYKAKWPDGFRCPRCGNNSAYEITSRKLPLYQCSHCRHQTSLTAGTVMEDSRTPLEKWYVALQRVSEPGGINAVQLMKDIGVTYKTAWLMLKKVREAISAYDREQPLSGTVRAEMAFYGQGDRMPRKRHPKEQSCVIMAEFRAEKPLVATKSVAKTMTETMTETITETMTETITETMTKTMTGKAGQTEWIMAGISADEKQTSVHKPGRIGELVFELEQCEYVKLKVVNSALVHNRMMPQVLQPMFLEKHVDASVQSGTGKDPLIPLHCLGETPMLKRLARQAKDAVNRTYRGIGPKYLQRYWDEFCFRFNLKQVKHSILDILACLCMRSA